jgi:hypothetical protein
MKQFEVGFEVGGALNRVPVQAYYHTTESGMLLFMDKDHRLICAFKEWLYFLEMASSRRVDAPQEFSQKSAIAVKSKLSVFSSKGS